jgi:CRP-like cAMP-binding protein
MEALRSYFNRFAPLSDEEWTAFASCIHIQSFRKREFLLQQGERCTFLAFIGEGAWRFYYEKEGVEKVTAFFFQGDFVTNYRSFLTGNASDHFIEAMSDSRVYVIAKDDLMRLYDRYQPIERLGRLIAESLYLTVAHRLDAFMHETPEERYAALVQRGSRLLQDVPQYMIASYLGVTPETLSRIRARR